MKRNLSGFFAVLFGAAVLGACTYQGGDIGDPLTRKAQWYSFVAGDDIRQTCATATPDRYRLVYNAIYDDQIRIYQTDSLRRIVDARAISQGNASRLSLDDLLGPWRAQASSAQLDQPGYDALVKSFADSGMFAPPPVGLDLPSRSYYWTAALCKDGKFSFTAWKHPSARFDALTFPPALFSLDATGVPVNQAKDVPFDPLWEQKAKNLETPVFTLTVGANGMVH